MTGPMAANALVDEDNKSPFNRLTQKTAWVVLLIVLPIQFAFSHAGYPGKGRVAAICTGMIVTVVWMRWNLRVRVWFWVAIALLFFLHVPLIFMVSWTDRSYPGVALLPLALLDLALIYGALKVVELLVEAINRRR